MKKIIQICSIFLFILCFSKQAQALGYFEMTFGRADNCIGWAVCTIRWVEFKTEKPTNLAQIEVLTNGHLSVSIDANTVSAADKQKYFSTGTFTMETPYLIFGPVQQQLGLKSPYTIAIGKYPIKYDAANHKINIIF